MTFQLSQPVPEFVAEDWTHHYRPLPLPGSTEFVIADFFVDYAETVTFRLDAVLIPGSGVTEVPATDILAMPRTGFVQVGGATLFQRRCRSLSFLGCNRAVVQVLEAFEWRFA